MIGPEGMRDKLNLEVGEDNLQLCVKGTGHCFRARIVAMCAKFPGFGTYSRYGYVNALSPGLIVTIEQMKFMIEDLQQHELDSDYIVPK